MRPESSLAVCDFLGVNFLRLRAAKTDSTCLPGHSRQRRQRSTPRSTARRAQGTLPPSTRSMLPPSSIPGQGLPIAISCDCRLRRGDRAGRRAGDRVSVEGRQVHFISFSFSLKSGEAQKRKKHTKRKKNQKFTLYDDSRAIIRPIRSLVHLARDRGKSKKSYQGWCVVWKGDNENSPYPRNQAPKPQKHAETRTPLSDRFSHVDLQIITDGGLVGNLAHTRICARTRAQIFIYAKRGAAKAAAAANLSHS